MSATRLIHLRLPEHLVDELDRQAGGRPRSAVVAEALEQYLRRKRLLETIRRAAGTLSDEERQIWGSREMVDAWVQERRREWETRHNPES